MNVQGAIDLLKLDYAGVVNIGNKMCVVIPIEENDIFVKADDQTKKASHAYLSLNVIERREPSQYGKTHYCKQNLSKNFRENRQEDTARKHNVYLGDFKELVFGGAGQTGQVSAPSVEVNGELPF